MKTKLEHFIHSAGFTSCLASIASILMGLLVGLVLLYAFNAPFALYGFKQILTAGFSALDKLAKVLYQAAPLKPACSTSAPPDNTPLAPFSPSPRPSSSSSPGTSPWWPV